MWAPGLVNFVAVAHYFCLVLPAASTQPGARLLAKPCRHFFIELDEHCLFELSEQCLLLNLTCFTEITMVFDLSNLELCLII